MNFVMLVLQYNAYNSKDVNRLMKHGTPTQNGHYLQGVEATKIYF